MDRCNCRPSAGYHQVHCDISRTHRRERIEAGKPPERPNPDRRAKVAELTDWGSSQVSTDGGNDWLLGIGLTVAALMFVAVIGLLVWLT